MKSKINKSMWIELNEHVNVGGDLLDLNLSILIQNKFKPVSTLLSHSQKHL